MARIAELKQLAAEKKIRLNKKWVSAETAESVRRQADALMRQGLELWKLEQEDGFKRKFSEASALEPEEIRDLALNAEEYAANARTHERTVLAADRPLDQEAMSQPGSDGPA